MAGWIIHIVGETIDDDLAPAVNKFVKEIQSLSHKVKQVRFTTDTGEKILHITDDVAKAVEDVAPEVAPEVAAVDAEVDKVVEDHTEPVTPPPVTPPPVIPPVSSATPVADPTATPVVPEPVDPPVAGASSTDSNPSSTAISVSPPAPIPTS